MNDHDRDPDPAPLPTLLAGRYRIVSPLGSGGMADVYLAEDERLGRPVAVKVLKARLAADDEFLERFRIEARAAASLSHPGIVAVYDRGSDDGATYIAMEYVCGESLKQRLRRDGALPPDEAVSIALAVLSALAAAHARAIVHRDVTSYNVMLEEGGRVVVTDFGIARMGDSALTRTGAMMGTSSYLSPEQAQGRQADERSDLYSLGVVLYEMLAGRVPFRGETDVAVAMQHVSSAPPNPRTLSPGVSEALAGVVMRALSKDPADRYQSAEEFAAALRTARRPVRPAGGDGVSAAGALAVPGGAVTAGAAGAGLLATGAGVAAATPAPVSFTPAVPSPQAVAPRPPAPVAPSPAAATPAPVPATVVAAEAPTRYRSGGELVTVRPHRRGRTRRVVLAAVLLAGAAAAAWAAYVYLLAPGATVPSVVGEGRADATSAVRGEGLKPALHFVWSDRYGSGEVARQAPRGGAKVDDGVKVDLWVSRGPLHIPSPDLAGLAVEVARDRLEAQSLNSKSRRAASETAPKGEVFRQEPGAGETVRRGDTVTFWVSSGPPRVYVPDVVGYSQGDASALLEEAGFVVSTDYVAGWGEIPGTVVGQDPLADVKGRVGDEVVIQVAIF
ncbi:MAG TPA: PASTA domain-containing protein [Thermoleophilia bacterium]|nr:PASTA domain-containing protein [Thermoleophilia bacterium]